MDELWEINRVSTPERIFKKMIEEMAQSDELWEINRVSTPERIFKKMIEEMPQPVGIVLFGADGERKDEIERRCMSSMPNLSIGYNGQNGDLAQDGTKRALSAGRSVLMVMSGETSRSCDDREQTVTMLRQMGAQTVVGIFAKVQPVMDMEAAPEQVQRDEQAWWLLNHPPIPDEFDYLLIPRNNKNRFCR